MAKKVVASFKSSTGKDLTKVIRMVKSPKTGAYIFKESVVPNEMVKEFLANKEIEFFQLPGESFFQFEESFFFIHRAGIR